jgi:hypothetical protein
MKACSGSEDAGQGLDGRPQQRLGGLATRDNVVYGHNLLQGRYALFHLRQHGMLSGIPLARSRGEPLATVFFEVRQTWHATESGAGPAGHHEFGFGSELFGHTALVRRGDSTCKKADIDAIQAIQFRLTRAEQVGPEDNVDPA